MQSALGSGLGWYPSVGVPETFDGKPSGVLVNHFLLFSVQFSFLNAFEHLVFPTAYNDELPRVL